MGAMDRRGRLGLSGVGERLPPTSCTQARAYDSRPACTRTRVRLASRLVLESTWVPKACGCHCQALCMAPVHLLQFRRKSPSACPSPPPRDTRARAACRRERTGRPRHHRSMRLLGVTLSKSPCTRRGGTRPPAATAPCPLRRSACPRAPRRRRRGPMRGSERASERARDRENGCSASCVSCAWERVSCAQLLDAIVSQRLLRLLTLCARGSAPAPSASAPVAHEQPRGPSANSPCPRR